MKRTPWATPLENQPRSSLLRPSFVTGFIIGFIGALILTVPMLVMAADALAPSLAPSLAPYCANFQENLPSPTELAGSAAGHFTSPASLANVATNSVGNWLQTRQLTTNEIYASKLYLRLTGVPASLTNPRFRKAVSLLDQQKRLEAAQLVTSDKNFLAVRVRNFAAPFTNKEFSPTEPLNDLQALIIGITRDQSDARLILMGDLRYSGTANLGLPPVSMANNDHYSQFESRNLSFDTDLEKVGPQWEGLGFGAGAFTTRAWAKAHYDAGTNRRALKYATEVFLCEPIETWKIRGIPDYFVRRDVFRNPGGDPSTYENTCRNCHSIMDPLAGAFAKLDFVAGSLVYMPNGVAAKYNQNGDHYPAGFVTTDDSWHNLMGHHPTIDFGWRGPLEGQGVTSFGQMFADSFAYSRCLSAKVFKEVCGKQIQQEFPELLDPIAQDFEQQGRNIRYLFAKIATLDQCLAH